MRKNFWKITKIRLVRIQVAPIPPKTKVTGVTTPIENQVATCKNKVRENRTAILAEKRKAKVLLLSIETKLDVVRNKLAGTRKAQIATQFCRENWEIGSKLSTIVYLCLMFNQFAHLTCDEVRLLTSQEPEYRITKHFL